MVYFNATVNYQAVNEIGNKKSKVRCFFFVFALLRRVLVLGTTN